MKDCISFGMQRGRCHFMTCQKCSVRFRDANNTQYRVVIQKKFIMATSKLDKEQFENAAKFAGIMLVYSSTGRDNVKTLSGQHFFGKEFEPADETDDEVFRVIKNMVATIWHTVAKEKELRNSADGIRSIFRSKTPDEIVICDQNKNKIVSYKLDGSVWKSIGLVPTKIDLEKSTREFEKTIHSAAMAIRSALGFKPNLPNLLQTEKPEEKSTKTAKIAA